MLWNSTHTSTNGVALLFHQFTEYPRHLDMAMNKPDPLQSYRALVLLENFDASRKIFSFLNIFSRMFLCYFIG